MKNKIFIVLILLVFAYSVSAIDLIEQDIGDYSFTQIDMDEGVSYQNVIEAQYSLLDSYYFVKILKFDNRDQLEDYFTSISKEEKFLYDNQIIYSEQNTNNWIWTNNNDVIIIGSKESNDFPDKLVQTYYSMYPNDFVIEDNTLFSFDEPEDIFEKVVQHTDVVYRCPEINSINNIRAKTEKVFSLPDSELEQIKRDCENSDFFNVEAVPIEGDIVVCYDHLAQLLTNNDLPASEKDIYRECYIRQYFNERFNKQTVPNYDPKFFDKLFEERDKLFIEYIILKKTSYINPEETQETGNPVDHSLDHIGERASEEGVTQDVGENIIIAIQQQVNNILNWFR